VKRPAFLFYPGDWLHDSALRACSLPARGLAIEVICLMHQGSPYGHLTLPALSNDGAKDILRPVLPNILARMVGASEDDVEQLLDELLSVGVFSRDAHGIIFSRRMIRDEQVRERRASGGFQSLNNPAVPRPKASLKDTLRSSSGGSFGGSPSFAVASSSSKISSSEFEENSDEVSANSRKKKHHKPSPEASKLAALLRSEILKNKPDFRVTQAQERSWARTADLTIRLDGRTYEQLAKLVAWTQRDEFWRSNVLSMETLRRKFDQLQMKQSAADARKPNTSADDYFKSGRVLPQTGADQVRISQIICQRNGWLGHEIIWALEAAIGYQAKRMPEATLEQVGEWLVRAYQEHQNTKGQFAVGIKKFLTEARYPSTVRTTRTSNPASRALADMEAS